MLEEVFAALHLDQDLRLVPLRRATRAVAVERLPVARRLGRPLRSLRLELEKYPLGDDAVRIERDRFHQKQTKE